MIETMVQSAVSERELDKILSLAAGRVALELGAWEGATTRELAKVCPVVHTVDHFYGDPCAGSRERKELLDVFFSAVEHDSVVVHVGSFAQVLPLLMPKQFGFTFVDGDHRYEHVLAQARYAQRLTVGPIAYHDYGLWGVAEAVHAAHDRTPDEVVESVAVYASD